MSKQLDAVAPAPTPKQSEAVESQSPQTANVIVPKVLPVEPKSDDDMKADNAMRADDAMKIDEVAESSEATLFIIDPPITASSRVVPFNKDADVINSAEDSVDHGKPGIGWSDAKKSKKQGKKDKPTKMSIAEQEAADAALARALAQDQELWTSDLGSQFDDMTDGDSNDISESIDDEDLDDNISDEDSASIDIDDMLEMLEGETQEEKDAELARMLAWQDRQSILDVGSSFGGGFMPATKGRRTNEGFISLKPEKPKRSRKNRGRDSFPSASALADAIEQDPYGGFDVMEFDRPSLRSKRAKKLGLDGVEPELANEITTMWEKDRQKKAQRKEERQELRAQGLLGRKSQKKAFRGGNARDITIIEIRECFQDFLEGDEDSFLMPPASDYSRKVIHQISHEFGIKSVSSGKGSDRRVNLIRTRRTQEYDDDIIEMFEDRFIMATNAGAGRQRKSKPPKKRNSTGAPKGRKSLPGRAGGGGGGNSAIGYREGEVVGAAAPEIGLENRGRGMLERMGWSAGMTLGTTGQGILQPIAHVVKNSKAGLG